MLAPLTLAVLLRLGQHPPTDRNPLVSGAPPHSEDSRL